MSDNEIDVAARSCSHHYMIAPPKRPTYGNRTLHHPAVLALAEKRGASISLRLADSITKFAGSMRFVYFHLAAFMVWMIVLEKSPWPTLTLIVSLEAIFLSTFVMIGQNRQAEFQQQKADHDFMTGRGDLEGNTELTRIIVTLTQEMHQKLFASSDSEGPELAEQGLRHHG